MKFLPFAPLLIVTAGLAAADESGRHAEQFVTEVLPLLESKCFGCHGGGDDVEGGLDMTSLDGLLAGGDGGPSLVPGDPSASAIFLATHADPEWLSAMPPQERNRLSDAERDAIAAWIRSGAHWTDPLDWSPGEESSPEGAGVVRVATSGGLSPTWDNRPYAPEDIWAWQPVSRPEVPWEDAGVDPESGNPVDAFLLRSLKAAGVDGFAPPADGRTLIRRLAFGLTGLPPSPDEADAAAAEGWNFESEVERLIDSPHYGERWAQQWLDVVRYADTGGFANDFERPNAWRYRDYVVRSFNAGKPLDDFIVEQVAGDELDPSDPEHLIAVGFLRTGPWEHTGMSVEAVTRQQYLDDVTHSVGVSLLGQGLRCASCHDHKFDPVPTRDYYRFQAAFAPVQFADREVPHLPEENVESFERAAARSDASIRSQWAVETAAREKNKVAQAAFLAERGLKSFDEIPADERPDKGKLGLSPLELTVSKLSRKYIAYFERERRRQKPRAMSVYSGPYRKVDSNKPDHPLPPAEKRRGEAAETHILTGGSIESPSEAVDPGVLTAMAGANDAASPTAWNTLPESTRGRRLALARWIASDANTLTARVFVNRAWQRHFGTGLVATANNFGKMGAKPTHPELLDWLAAWFMDNGWSVKKLDRLIVTSDAYRQASSRPDMDAAVAADPADQLLSRFPVRRLTAEELRDAMLAASGELNREIGGLPVFPNLHWEVATQPRHIMGSLAPVYLPSNKKSDRDRRTLYAFRTRTLADPMLEVFNRPVTETSCERRDETTVATQALALLNSKSSQARAVAMAASIAGTAVGTGERVATAFRRAMLRNPTADEKASAVDHVEAMTAHHRGEEPPADNLPTSVRRRYVEELTGEAIEWDEPIVGLDGYEPDLSPADVTPDVRALAELCLVLLNSNEFAYVR